jgi:hypothetical protein
LDWAILNRQLGCCHLCGVVVVVVVVVVVEVELKRIAKETIMT